MAKIVILAVTIVAILSFGCDVFCEESQSQAISSGMQEILECMGVGYIAKHQVESAGLDWNDISKKMIEKGWANPTIKSTEMFLNLKVNLEAEKSRMAEVFGDKFTKLLPVLQHAYNEDIKGVIAAMSKVDSEHSEEQFNSILDTILDFYPNISKVKIGYQIFLHWSGYVEMYREYFNYGKSSDETLYDFALGVKNIIESKGKKGKKRTQVEESDGFQKAINIYIGQLNEKLIKEFNQQKTSGTKNPL